MVDEQRRIEVAMLVCPDYAPVDVIGLHAVMASMPGVNVHLVWKNLDEFLGYGGFPTRATTTFADCPADLDVLLVGATPTEGGVLGAGRTGSTVRQLPPPIAMRSPPPQGED